MTRRKVGVVLKEVEADCRRLHYLKLRKTRVVSDTPKQCMMGKGLGNNLGLDEPEYTVWKTKAQRKLEEEQEAIDREERRVRGLERAAITRARNKTRTAVLAVKMDRGELLAGQCVFQIEWSMRGDWEERANVLGGMPKGVDVARTSFGRLLIVPVVEHEKGKVPHKDPYGRGFHVPVELKTVVSKIFGKVKWARPLTMDETRQFGVEFVEVD